MYWQVNVFCLANKNTESNRKSLKKNTQFTGELNSHRINAKNRLEPGKQLSCLCKQGDYALVVGEDYSVYSKVELIQPVGDSVKMSFGDLPKR